MVQDNDSNQSSHRNSHKSNKSRKLDHPMKENVDLKRRTSMVEANVKDPKIQRQSHKFAQNKRSKT